MTDLAGNGASAPATAIAAHGVIGDLHTAALVGSDGSVDWWCMPRFDSPSVFAGLLDAGRGGRWRIAPAVPATAEQHYLPGTNVLVTSFRVQEGGVLEVVDLMPVGARRGKLGRLMRRVRAVRGSVPAEVLWEPRLEYGSCPTQLLKRTHGVLATDRYDDVVAVCATEGVRWTLREDSATARLVLAEGAQAWFVMTHDDDEVRPLASHEPDATLDETVKWWDGWSSSLRYDGPYRAEVERSALALKLCCYEPTGR